MEGEEGDQRVEEEKGVNRMVEDFRDDFDDRSKDSQDATTPIRHSDKIAFRIPLSVGWKKDER